MSRRWGVGIMGLGHWYSAYALARTLVEDPRATLVAVAWPQTSQVQEFATTFGAEAYTAYDALLQRQDIDIVHIVPPVADIPACTIKAAQAGKHLILGKPMAMTVAQATAMVEAVAAFTFANGIIATFEASWTINAPQKTGPSPKQNSVRRLEIIGTRGEIIEESLRVPERAVLAAGASGWSFERDLSVPYGPPVFSPLAHVLDCLEHHRRPAVTIQEARAAFQVAMAAYTAARQGSAISLRQ